MDYRNFSFSNPDYIILAEKTISYPTDSGKSWTRKGEQVERYIYTPEQYTNYITAIPFFNNFGDGASCRARCGYTCAGYIPTSVTSVAPFRSERHVMTFRFINIRRAYDTAGYREKNVLDNVQTWEHFPTDGSPCYTFVAGENTATYQPGYNRWVN